MCLSVPLRNSSLANVSNRSSAEFKSVRMFRIGRSSVCSGPARPSGRPTARPWRRGVWGVQPPFPIRPCRPFPNRPCRPLHNRGPKHVYGGTAPRRTSSNQQSVPAAASSGSSQQYRGRQLWEGRREVGRSTSMVLARVLAIRSPSREVELQADLWKPMKAETKSSWAREGVRKFSFWACENFCFKAWLPIWQQAHRAHRLTTKSNAKCFLKTEARQQRMRR